MIEMIEETAVDRSTCLSIKSIERERKEERGRESTGYTQFNGHLWDGALCVYVCVVRETMMMRMRMMRMMKMMSGRTVWR